MWKKVVAPTLVMSLLWLTGGLATNYYIRWLHASENQVLAREGAAVLTASQMQGVLWRLQAAVMAVAEGGREELRGEVQERQAEFEQLLENLDRIALAPSERAQVGIIRAEYSLYREGVERVLEQPGTAKQHPASDSTMQLSQMVDSACNLLSRHSSRLLDHSTDRRVLLSKAVILLHQVLLFAGPTIGILFGFWVARGLYRSIYQLSVNLKDATVGLEQFVGSVKISPSGELSEVQQQAREVASRIGHVVRELHQARSDAMRADRMAAVGELAAGVAHELRNPLTSLKLLIQAAAHRGRPLTERQLHVLQDEIVRMENTIRGLLDFTRAPQIRRVRHDVRDTVRRALNLVQARAKQTSVSIIEDLSAECVMVDGDPELLHQVFINLMLNALEAMSNGGTLRVFVGHAPGDSHMCLVEVSDSGPGIPQDLLARLFEPFVSGKEQGYGLGLAVSSRIVREHGGKLSACNRAEGGAVFTLELPACPAAAESPVAALMSTE